MLFQDEHLEDNCLLNHMYKRKLHYELTVKLNYHLYLYDLL